MADLCNTLKSLLMNFPAHNYGNVEDRFEKFVVLFLKSVVLY